MLILEVKLKGRPQQFEAIDGAIRAAQFIRNKAVEYWQNHTTAGKHDLNKYCAVLAQEFEWAQKLNSMARQASAERAWSSIARFLDSRRRKISGKRRFPRFKHNSRTVEYKSTGWKLSDDRKSITFTDGFQIGQLRLIGTYDLSYQRDLIKRVRLVRRADGYYCQFCVDVERQVNHTYNGAMAGLDMGLDDFCTTTSGERIASPAGIARSERGFRRLRRRLNRKQKKSKNRSKLVRRLNRKYLKLTRQRKDFAIKSAKALCESNDLIVYENLKIRPRSRRYRQCRSFSDDIWPVFARWLEYYARLHRIVTVALSPRFSRTLCPRCGHPQQQALSSRTHCCVQCGHRETRAAQLLAREILVRGIQQLSTAGHVETAGLEPEKSLGREAPLPGTGN
ncbi:RNA-guided endonuclease InsQ/TnpB family protein [Gloeobacter kilaueensis]|uniref:Transposase n=1 Tax=Gloeobacter kilaueensis (strain ATCC BAA-2537 / CCAP 1431/1 / ULC 316 / JS1) TaxID=1183438 RepID=U5QGG1_GLOK1|nr:RNA-guided endonuclease TnpB family protein [Gloeobacter kilaueensis]AGY56724.1 transposase [Gloeobacter kilaueensis JS1]